MKTDIYYLKSRNKTTDKKQHVVKKAQGGLMLLSRYSVTHKEII